MGRKAGDLTWSIPCRYERDVNAGLSLGRLRFYAARGSEDNEGPMTEPIRYVD